MRKTVVEAIAAMIAKSRAGGHSLDPLPSDYELGAAIVETLPSALPPLVWEISARHGNRVKHSGRYQIVTSFEGSNPFYVVYHYGNHILRDIPLNSEQKAISEVEKHRAKLFAKEMGVLSTG